MFVGNLRASMQIKRTRMYDITTPALLFSAISLIILAFTNRFLAYAALVRSLKLEHEKCPACHTYLAQLQNLFKRLHLVRAMQLLGLASLMSCVLAMFLIYIGADTASLYLFGFALLCLLSSLLISAWEVIISVRSLELHLSDIRQKIAGDEKMKK